MHSQNYYKQYDSLKKGLNINVKKITDSLISLANEKRRYNYGAKIAHSYSVEMYAIGNYKKAIEYANKEIGFLEKDQVNATYINAIYNKGVFCRLNYQYDKAIKAQKRVINLGLDEQKIAQAYKEIGNCYYKKGNYYEAKNFIEKSISLSEKISDYNNLFNSYISLLEVFARLENDLNHKVKIANKMNNLKSKISFSYEMEISLNTAYANLYIDSKKIDLKKAKLYYTKNFNLGFESKDSSLIGGGLLDMAYYYNLEKNDSALYFAKKSIDYLPNHMENLVYAYENYSEYYEINKEYEKAIELIDDAISLNIVMEDSINKIPTTSELFFCYNNEQVLYSLKRKSRLNIFLYMEKGKKINLINAVKMTESVDELIKIILNNSSENASKLLLRREASQAYVYGADAAHLLGDEELAFSFMEKNKALLLSESVLKNTEFANLPKNISDQETRLQKLIYELENKLSKQEDNGILQDSLFNAKLTHEKYVDSLKVVFPKYFDRKIEVAQVPLSEVQNELQKNQVLVSYIWNQFDEDNELLIGLATSKDKTITFEVKDTKTLKEKLSTYRKLISSPQTTKENQATYQKVAYELYQDLFPTEEIKNLIQGKNLLIIPDGDLQNIPFESFTTKNNSNDYLILQSDINYSYSYSFLQHNDKVERTTNETFVGYSPVTFENQELVTLKNSKQEIERIADELNGIKKLKEEASKEDFLKKSSQSKIIHLATHADAGENPWIAFADKKLELHELYTYKNNAELVTLSACNTSLGEMAKGEGVLSLARGFFHSGSKSVVSSLWNVNDTSTSDIMTDFYRNLKEGQTKSEALNNAKRNYLTTHSLSEQSPYYWSSFVLIGDAEAIYASHNYIYYILGAILFCILFLFFRKKRFS